MNRNSSPRSDPGSVIDRTAATMSSTKSEGIRSLFARSMPFTTPWRMIHAPTSTATTWKITGCQPEPVNPLQNSPGLTPCSSPVSAATKFTAASSR